MNDSNFTNAFRITLHVLVRLFVLSLLLFAWSVEATAPRVAPKMFGEARQVDVVGYYSSQSSPSAETKGKLTADLLNAAFQAGGMQPNIDVLPAKQLAKYEFVVNQVPALIVAADDLSAKEKKRYRTVSYFLSDVANAKTPVFLAFDLKNPRSVKLYKAFDKGLQKIIKSGKYLDLMQRHLGKEAIPAGYLGHLKRQNPSWK